MSQRVLIVDDDVDACGLLEAMLPRLGYAPHTANDGEQALEALERSEFDMVLTDLAMPRMDGLELCRRVKVKRPWLPVVLITGHHEMTNALEAMRAGASDFLAKPIDDKLLVPCLARSSRFGTVTKAMRKAKRILSSTPVNSIIGDCTPMKRVHELIDQVATSDATVLVGGETGTGKELVARAIHMKGPRAAGPFVAVNCAAIPATLVESELFGHAKGAFTDASSDREGLFVKASGGTLFLDEIGELPLEIQPKLLRALQQRTVRAVGSNTERPFDTRIITATNRDLEVEVAERRFREDLFYRINVVRIDLPPLRDRGTDVLAIAQHLLSKMAPDGSLSLSAAVAERLLAYGWPGNVRELENCVERAVALARYPEISVDDLPDRLRGGQEVLPDLFQGSRLLTVYELERRYIQHTLKILNGNKTRAAQLLGLDRRTLYRKLDKERADVSELAAPSSGAPGAEDDGGPLPV